MWLATATREPAPITPTATIVMGNTICIGMLASFSGKKWMWLKAEITVIFIIQGESKSSFHTLVFPVYNDILYEIGVFMIWGWKGSSVEWITFRCSISFLRDIRLCDSRFHKKSFIGSWLSLLSNNAVKLIHYSIWWSVITQQRNKKQTIVVPKVINRTKTCLFSL